MAEVPFGIQIWSATDDDGEDRPGWIDIYTTLIDPPSGYLPDSVTGPVYRLLRSEFAPDVDVTESDHSFSIAVEASEAGYWLDRVMDAVSSERVRSVVRKKLIPHGSPEWEARRSKAVRSLSGAGGGDGEWEFSIRTKPAMTQINGAPPVLIEGQSVIIVGPKSVPELAGDAGQQQRDILGGIAQAIWKVVSRPPTDVQNPQWIEDRLALEFQVPDGRVGIRAAQVRDVFQTVEVRELLVQLLTLWESTETERAPEESR